MEGTGRGIFVCLLLLAGIAVIVWMVLRGLYRHVYERHDRSAASNRLNGQELAEKLLAEHGGGYRVYPTVGNLSDNLVPGRNDLLLNYKVCHSRSVAAQAVAAHDVAHALKYREHCGRYQAWFFCGKVIAAFPVAGVLLALVGWLQLFNIKWPLIAIGVGMYVAPLLYQLATLPVQIGANRLAKELLSEENRLNEYELHAAKKVLRVIALQGVIPAVLQLFTLIPPSLWEVFLSSRYRYRRELVDTVADRFDRFE